MTENLHTVTSTRAPSSRTPRVREYLDLHQPELLDMFATPGAAGFALARRHAHIMDGLLVMLHDAALAAVDPQRRAPPFVLGAVGGYGRELLGWKSDLDVRFVTRASADKIQPVVEAILYALWDGGVSIGHQVVTIDDAVRAARIDLPTATALLDFRVLAGARVLADELRERVCNDVFSEAHFPRFLSQLETEASVRHRRLGDSVYLLEPDVKNGTGGLRDLDLALWAARARWKTNQPSELAQLGIVSARDAEDVLRGADFLWTVRNRLHYRAGRKCDRLTFAEQETIAQALQYAGPLSDVPSASQEQLLGASVEVFMSDYYRHARNLTRVCEQIMGRTKRRPRRRARKEQDLGGGLCACDGGVGLIDPSQLAADPALVLRLYSVAVERDMSVLGRSRDAVTRTASDAEFALALRSNAEANQLFVQLASTARQARFRNGSILGELHDVGLLLAMIPEFAPVVGRVHHDLYHVYTVDVHSVAAVDRLRALLRGELAEDHALAHRLAGEVDRRHVLCLATLLHDVGKAIGGTGHARRGAEMANLILTRMGFTPEDREAACQLVSKHLKMYLAAVRRDLEDPSTLAEFVREVQGRAGLRDLYLLTVVDLSTTSPTSMTKWKAGMLDALFHASDAQLSGTSRTEPGWLSRVRAQIKEHWASQNDAAFLNEFIDTMPERYLLSNSAAEITAHARVAQCLAGNPVSAALVPSRHPDVAELCVVTAAGPAAGLCVVTDDRPGLLAAIAAVITAGRLEIHAAQIHSRVLPGGAVQAVDLFWVRSPEGADGVKDTLPKLQHDLEQVITGRIAPKELLKRKAVSRWSERPQPMVPTEVVFDHDASAEHSVIEVLTKDRPGLLFMLAQGLHELGVSIGVAKISTEGSRVSDVFYVTEFDGHKLDSGDRTRMVREGLLKLLGAPRAQA